MPPRYFVPVKTAEELVAECTRVPESSGCRALPIIKYKGENFFVDFKLGEMRNPNMRKIIKFTELKEDKYSPIKQELRGLRARTWRNEYIRGVDD